MVNSYSDAYDGVFGRKSRILLVFAHPDDMEINCGGLVARLSSDKKAIRLICLTAGEKGVRDSQIEIARFKSIRERALIEAASVAGIASREVICFDLGDGCIEDNLTNIGRIVEQIRVFQPDIVITHNPAGRIHTVDGSYYYVNHRDHRITGSLTLDAIYPYSRDWAFFPEHQSLGLKGHIVNEVLFGDSFDDKTATAFAITDHIETKREALRIHMAAGAMTEEQFESYSREGVTPNGIFEILGWHKGIHLRQYPNQASPFLI